MSNPFLFLHIPKTAGTTLNKVFDVNLPEGTILDLYTRDQHESFKDKTYDDLAEYKLIRGHVFIERFEDILDGPFPLKVFTFLRDPIERVISEYFFLRQWPKSQLYNYLNENDVSLAEYVASDTPPLRRRGRNNMTNSLCGVMAKDGNERLERAWHHLRERFVFFGLLERFDESLVMLAAHMGMRHLYHERQNVLMVHGDRQVSTSDMELIRQCNQLDVALYERAQIEFDRRVRAQSSDFADKVRMFAHVNRRFQRVAHLVHEAEGHTAGAFLNGK